VRLVSPFLESDVFNLCLRVAGSREAAAAATMSVFDAAGREPELRRLVSARRELARLTQDPPRDLPPAESMLPVAEANGRLAVRHREALALRELLGCSYEQMGRIVEADREAIAELLWQARLALHDELNGSRLGAIAPVAESCRRALALIAMDWDSELHDGGERDRLRTHLRTCGKCRVSQRAARQASATYREWPAAALPLGLRESLPSSDPAESQGAESERSSRRPPGSPPPGALRDARRSPG
jgi:hypothetical protein